MTALTANECIEKAEQYALGAVHLAEKTEKADDNFKLMLYIASVEMLSNISSAFSNLAQAKKQR